MHAFWSCNKTKRQQKADPVPAESTVEGQEAEAEDNNSSNNGGWTKSGSRFQFLNPAKRMSGKNTTTKSQAGAKGRFSSARGSGSGEEIVNRMRALQPQQLLMQPPRTRFRSSRAPTVATIADGEPSDQKQGTTPASSTMNQPEVVLQTMGSHNMTKTLPT